MARKKFKKDNRKRNFLIQSFILLFLFIGIGYATLSTNLSIGGVLGVSGVHYEPDGTAYGIMEAAGKNRELVKVYTGSHHDSFTEEPTKPIYYWYAENTAEGTAIKNKNNVIFADHCWQMIRTTDTGGVKLLYNGEVVDGKCLSSRGKHVGYASRTTQSMNTSYYYGTSYTYDSIDNFLLSGSVTTGAIKTGQYTCKATEANSTCTTLYYVDTLSSGTTYYVLPLNANSHYSQFGMLQFNIDSNSLSYVGYMYNEVYPYQKKAMTSTEKMYSSASLETSYWYANSATWGTPVSNSYNLDNPYQANSTDNYPSLVGEYTFRNATQSYTNTSVYYIAAVNDTTMYYIQLSNSVNHTLADYNYTYTFGDSYTDNGNGTYTINNATIINRSEWYTNYSNVGVNKYVCKNAINDTCSELWYTTEISNTAMTYIRVVNNKYAREFEYKQDPDDGVYKYFLKDENAISIWNINDSYNITSLSSAHYTCWNETGKCTTLSYVHFLNDALVYYYINLANGKSLEDAKNEMLYDDDVNTKNSILKTGIDVWYENNLLEYSNYLEDTVFCNDRSESNSDSNGWNPNGGSILTNLSFYGSNDLSCPNTTDQFSTLNDKAKLKYKVGLLNYRELSMLGDPSLKRTGQYYWVGSPGSFRKGAVADEMTVHSTNGVIGHFINVDGSAGVRPAISLKPGVEITSGDGSPETPYVVLVDH